MFADLILAGATCAYNKLLLRVGLKRQEPICQGMTTESEHGCRNIKTIEGAHSAELIAFKCRKRISKDIV